MGIDIFVQAFENGDAVGMPSSAFDVFRPFVDRVAPEYDCWHISVPGGDDATIYAEVTPETCGGLMMNHFSPGRPLDLLADFAVRAGGVIFASGDGPAMLTSEAQREHLPEDFDFGLVLIRTGDGIRQALRIRWPASAHRQWADC
jgi:hypothetical protein